MTYIPRRNAPLDIIFRFFSFVDHTQPMPPCALRVRARALAIDPRGSGEGRPLRRPTANGRRFPGKYISIICLMNLIVPLTPGRSGRCSGDQQEMQHKQQQNQQRGQWAQKQKQKQTQTQWG